MKKTLLAGASALALVLTVSAAYAHDKNINKADNGSNAAAQGGTILSNSTASPTDVRVISKNDLDAHFGGTDITTAAAASGGTGGGSTNGNAGAGGAAAAAAGALNNGDISQSGNAFQNFAGVNTMTQSSAEYNNNQAATSIAAYAPVAFASGGAAAH